MIDGGLLQELVAANTGKNAIAFTHKPVHGDEPVAIENRRLLVGSTKTGFTVNLSANTSRACGQVGCPCSFYSIGDSLLFGAASASEPDKRAGAGRRWVL